jgi:hypothetical protein
MIDQYRSEFDDIITGEQQRIGEEGAEKQAKEKKKINSSSNAIIVSFPEVSPHLAVLKVDWDCRETGRLLLGQW